jgi:hypothetical protein
MNVFIIFYQFIGISDNVVKKSVKKIYHWLPVSFPLFFASVTQAAVLVYVAFA